MKDAVISGEIEFEKRPSLPEGTKIYIRLLDTTQADAAAKLIAEKVLSDISVKANGGQPIRFTIQAKIDNPQGSYSIGVLVDTDGDGKSSKGDFINMQSYPVLTFGYPDKVTVLVKPI